jgi:hypothetical protein
MFNKNYTCYDPNAFKNLSQNDKEKFISSVRLIKEMYVGTELSQNLWINPKTYCVYQDTSNEKQISDHLVPLSQFIKNSWIGWRGWQTFFPINSSTSKTEDDSLMSQKKTANKNEEEKLSHLLNSNLKLKKHKRIKKVLKKTLKGCGCSNSKCLRLHCKCFKNNLLCGVHCNCTGCFNNQNHTKLINEIKRETKQICSQAFNSPMIKLKINDKIQTFSKGCSCSNYQCLKNYCGCHKNGFACNPLCKCVDCGNSKIRMEPELANKLYIKSLIYKRKKNKSVNIKKFIN